MGRPLKKGLHYFNIDCIQEDNLNYIEARHGITGYGVWVKLLRKIYMIEGYYCEWSEKNLFIFSKEIGVEADTVKEVVESCLSEGLFHPDMLKNHGVLTSAGIQKRYLKIVSEAKRKGCDIRQELSLLEFTPENLEFIPEETTINSVVNPEESTQKKRKENKIKEKKGNNPNGVAPAQPAPVKGQGKRKDEDPEPYWELLVKAWFDFHTKNSLDQPSFAGRDPRTFKQLVQLLKKRAAKKNLEWTAENAFGSLDYFLTLAFREEWLKKHFTISNLVEQFDPVYQRANLEKQKSKQPAAAEAKPQTFNEQLRYLYDRYLEGDLDPRAIDPLIYDKLVTGNVITVGAMEQQPGNTIEDKKRNAVLAFFKQKADAKNSSNTNENMPAAV